MGNPKPPIAVKVRSIRDFGRLTLSLTDSPPLLWHFKLDRKQYLGAFSVYMSWKGDIPVLSYITLRENPGPFLAYKADGESEECFFSNNIDDTRYVFGPVVNMRKPPALFKESVTGKFPSPQKPLTVELENTESLLRLLYLISAKEYTSFPVWYFERKSKRIMGVVVPFEHYYESNALPVFFYLQLKKPPEGPFLRYFTSKGHGESYGYSNTAGEVKYFYAKIVNVEDMPLFPSEK
ncbi:MAG: hypothetical protein ACE5PO_00795 [Candidatus Bathyarchaeia archaeon]